MSRNLHRKPPEQEDEGWLITFADMSVLLMCFFILMFALASPESKAVMEQVKSSLRDQGFHNDALPVTDPVEELKEQLSLAIANKGYDRYLAVHETLQGVDMELAASAFFAPGSAKLSADALPMLDAVATQLLPLANQDITVEIVGHTDSSVVASEYYPSNWELSAARASNVVRYLIARHFPAVKMRAVGAADTVPKAPNMDEAGNPLPANQALNRRVVIRVIRGEDN